MAKKITNINEIHKLQLELLTYFHKICIDNNLNYFLAGGTLLGAVRHKGFIPWDDDIDIAMPRKDYEKFLIISKNFQDDYKTLIPAETDNFHLVFAKLVNKNYYNNKKTLKGKYGIRMDIFPLDGLGNTEMESIKQAKRIMFYRKFYSICFKDNILSKLLYKINFHKLAYKLLSKVFNKYTFEDSKYVGSVIGGLRELKEIFEYRVYSETMDMEFEGKTFKGMKYYDEYLTRMYGDYMKLPPKEKQVAEHNVEIYDMRGE